MTTLIYAFDASETPTLSDVGGKALSLISTTAAGLPVPAGFALSVAFFGPWTKAVKQTPQWSALLKAPTKKNCDLVKGLASKMVLTDDQRAALETHLDQIDGTGPFAVRSSSPEEDLSGTSFAGMYETFLGTTRAMLEGAIANAFSSMFDTRVMEYKAQHRLALEGANISIIVQRQIASDVSGVAFSLNPMNNCFDEAVIDASFGLGEAIVSGIVTPDNYIVEKVTMEVLEKRVSEKSLALQLNPDGGISQTVPLQPKAQALTETQILELTELIKATEDHYGFPVDIEWAYESGTLYLLQARPITTFFPLFPELITAPDERKKLYMDIMPLSQGFSDNLSILGGEVWDIVLDKLKMGAVPLGEDGYIVGLHGRQYFQLNNVFKGLGKRGMQMASSLDNAFEGREDEIFKEYISAEMTPLMKKGRRAQIAMLLTLGPGMVGSFFNPEKAAKTVETAVDNLLTFFKGMKNDRPFDEVVESAFVAFDENFKGMVGFIAGVLAEGGLKKILKGTEAEALTQAIMMDVPSNPSSAMGHEMLALASAREIRKTEDAAIFEDRITNRTYSPEFMAAFDDYLYKFGDRGFKEIDVASPRVSERLGEFFVQLKAFNLDDNQMMKVAARKHEAIEKMRVVARERGKLKKFDKSLRTIELLFGHRETPKYMVVVMNGCLHRLALEIADGFVAQGRLENRNQIFDLTIEQVSQAQKNAGLDLLPLVAANTEPQKLYEGVKDFPVFIDSRGKIFRKQLVAGDGDLAGMAVSNGTYTGRARVLLSPYEKPLLPGEILVTVATEPSWTPIFVNASAVVLEVGGGLQHGAIIAREYGLPCVSGLPGVTKIIKDGDLLEVDGTNGIVKFLEKAV
ncbi:PEP/pyruvate-binding domain-containing protein [Devosia rhodophyticola]|uniref:PEP/pyruvate-binding domain-containing protein n=1 Tax=Devosia rhodophyticola TaxID=3026423 RepID=A0ABY7Z1F9_9HYPH|nr:PEP/pyruvate-binding domain-containing protein [Devosia rhodophyticola]WDR06939.1 PEP/pyruvate-binding domain-containing protein [Devosia rhodophyticola]